MFIFMLKFFINDVVALKRAVFFQTITAKTVVIVEVPNEILLLLVLVRLTSLWTVPIASFHFRAGLVDRDRKLRLGFDFDGFVVRLTIQNVAEKSCRFHFYRMSTHVFHQHRFWICNQYGKRVHKRFPTLELTNPGPEDSSCTLIAEL